MKRTAGTWDPDQRGVFFTVGHLLAAHLEDNPEPRFTRPHISNLFAVNDLAIYRGELNRTALIFRMFDLSLKTGCRTFLDSGIFWLTNEHKRAHGTTMDQALSLPPEAIDGFDWLLETYIKICREYGDRLWGYNELDQGGADNKRRTRAILEAEGLAPIPVYHPLNDGWDYFDELAEQYDRICVGNLVQANGSIRKRILATIFQRHRKYPDLFIHFLGLTPNQIQAGLPFDSADSSTWQGIMRWPTAHACAMGQRSYTWQSRFQPPLTRGGDEDLIARGELVRASGNIALLDQYATERSLRHWHAELAEAFQTETYPPL